MTIRTTVLLSIIVLLGVTLRFWGITYDLPNDYQFDENYIMDGAVAVADGKLRHGAILYGSLPLYTVGTAVRFVSLVLPQLHIGYPTYTQSYQQNQTVFNLIGRFMNGAYGTIEIIILFWLACIVFGKNIGLMSAFFLSVSKLTIEFAHVIKPDIALSTTMLLTVTIAIIAYRKNSIPLFMFSALLTGISGGQKFPGLLTLFFVLSLFFIQSFYYKKTFIHTLAFVFTLIFVSGIGYVLSYPFIFKDLHLLAQEWRLESGTMRFWDKPPYVNIGYLHRLVQAASWLRTGTGTFYFYFSILGIILMIKQKNVIPILLGLFGVLFFFMNAFPIKQGLGRYIPLVPYICLSASYALNRWMKNFSRMTHPKRFRVLGLMLLMFISSAAPFMKSFFLVNAYASTDTRNLAYVWISRQYLDEVSILRDPSTINQADVTINLADPHYSHQRERLTHKQSLQSLGHFRYAVISDEWVQWYYQWEQYQPELHRQADVFRYIESKTKKIAEFVPRLTNIEEEDLEFLLHTPRWTFDQIRGPKITIYKLQ